MGKNKNIIQFKNKNIIMSKDSEFKNAINDVLTRKHKYRKCKFNMSDMVKNEMTKTKY